jgi:hypothetical protein
MVKKITYILLFIACFAAFFIINISNVFEPPFSIALIATLVFVSIIEALLPYLIIILIIRLIDRNNRSS